ncbi:MAG: sugar phosphate isomerase/epimerase [Clostridiales bacterium]|nr:sugar phosphate isomerase/epimerase [Clostridiales bacterium]
MKIGVRAHDYGKRSIREMAELLHDEGYRAAQVVLPKAFIEIDRYEDVTSAHLEKIRREFAKNDITIAVLGCYMDLGNPDPDVRKAGIATFRQCLAYGKELGAGVVGTETAYPHLEPEDRKRWKPYMIDSIQRIMEEAQRVDMQVGLEPVYWHPLTDLDTLMEVIRMINDPKHLRIIFDAGNLLEFPDQTDQGSLWTQWLDTIGEMIDILHIKDFTLGRHGVYQPEPLGRGVMDYTVISQWLQMQEREIPLIREEMNLLFAKDDIAFMRNL